MVHDKMLVGENWFLARTGRMAVAFELPCVRRLLKVRSSQVEEKVLETNILSFPDKIFLNQNLKRNVLSHF